MSFRIKVAQRLRPFTHLPGTRAILPGSDLRLRLFPTRVEIENQGALSLSLPAPMQNFTACMDLEQPALRFWGNTAAGFVRWALKATERSVELVCDKAPPGAQFSWGDRPIQPAESLFPLEGVKQLSSERLSLGNHRQPLWERLAESADLTAILPLWLRLGQSTPAIRFPTAGGTASLLLQIAEAAPERKGELFRTLLRTGFDGLLSPRLSDSDHWGHTFPPLLPGSSPLALLTEGARLLRSLLFQQKGREIAILPSCLPEFHAGRYLDIDCDGEATLHFEWTKKCIRRLIFTPRVSGEWNFLFRGAVRQFRLRPSGSNRGGFFAVDTPLSFEAGHNYFFDHFT